MFYKFTSADIAPIEDWCDIYAIETVLFGSLIEALDNSDISRLDIVALEKMSVEFFEKAVSRRNISSEKQFEYLEKELRFISDNSSILLSVEKTDLPQVLGLRENVFFDCIKHSDFLSYVQDFADKMKLFGFRDQVQQA